MDFVSMRFLGNIEAKLDAKNRVFLPASFRRVLQNEMQEDVCTLYLRKDVFQNCIVLYPAPVWEAELAQMGSRLNLWNRDQKEIYRQFVMDAESVEMSSNGRILLPKRLLSLVGIVSEVRFLGLDSTIEIWPKEELDKPRLSTEDFQSRIQEIFK